MPTVNQIQARLEVIETSLSELEVIGDEKRSALTTFDASNLVSAAAKQCQIAQSIAASIQPPGEPARDDGHSTSLRAWMAGLDDHARSTLDERLAALRDKAARIKLQIAADWLMTWKLNQVVSESLAILGRARQAQGREPHHGLVIDSTA